MLLTLVSGGEVLGGQLDPALFGAKGLTQKLAVEE